MSLESNMDKHDINLDYSIRLRIYFYNKLAWN
jgi:hypothetical protein